MTTVVTIAAQSASPRRISGLCSVDRLAAGRQVVKHNPLTVTENQGIEVFHQERPSNVERVQLLR